MPYSNIRYQISLISIVTLFAPLPSIVSAQQVLYAFSNPVASAPAAGSVVGKVTTAAPADLTGMKLVLLDSDGLVATTAVESAPDGSTFAFQSIAPGTYTLDIDTSSTRKYHAHPTSIVVEAGRRMQTAITVEPRRFISGLAYVDMNSDGVFSPGKDVPVAGAEISGAGAFAVSAADGSFQLEDLPPGRTSIVVRWPGSDRTTHVILDLPNGPVTNRSVNIGLFR